MFTKFNITLTDGDKKRYTVDLGVNILEGVDDAVIVKMAARQAVVDLQNNTDTKLRSSKDGNALLASLTARFPNVTVVDHVPTGPGKKPMTVADIKKAIAEGTITPEEVQKLLGG